MNVGIVLSWEDGRAEANANRVLSLNARGTRRASRASRRLGLLRGFRGDSKQAGNRGRHAGQGLGLSGGTILH
jgi:hypothetical protein